ncbi:hypothetical protein AGMMS4957_15990 [Bacteroidia bacterium]|nr:hypothetical protein AGMMS4957_15990 [Bacteroidia bacterium]
MKKIVLTIASLLLTVSGFAETTWTSGSTTAVLSDDGTLTVSGTGAMEDFYGANYRNAIRAVVINAGITDIGYGAFGNCVNLVSVTISNGVERIGDGAFQKCNFASFSVPSSVTNIGDLVFLGNCNLAAIDVAEDNPNYKSVDGVLYNKSQDTLLFYPGGKQGAFSIPEGVKTIKDDAFDICFSSISMPTISISGSVTDIPERIFQNSSLTAINVDASNMQYSSVDGVLYNKTQYTLLRYPRGKQGVFTVPEGVKTIGDHAFAGCAGLTSISIPKTVTLFDTYNSVVWTFEGSLNLAAIDVAEDNPNYKSVDGIVYNKAQDILLIYPHGKQDAKFTIPDGVTTIGNAAFEVATHLTSVTIPASVTGIELHAFNGCENLTSVICLATTPPSLGGTNFTHYENDVQVKTPTLYVPAASLSAYQGNSDWNSKFGAILPYMPVSNFALDQETLDLSVGETGQLTATILPADATNRQIRWASSDESVATVINGLVAAVSVGTATITVTLDEGNRTHTCTVTVAAATPVTDITLDKTTVSLLVGATEQLTATVLPENAENKDVSWSSLDESVATVDNTGLVRAIATGSTIITATTTNGDQPATCTVIVQDIVEGEPAGANGQGSINFTLTIPSNVLFEGSFDIELPAGLTLDETQTALNADLASLYKLNITNKGNGKWTLSIAPNSQLSSPANSGLRSVRSASEMVARKLLDIVYTVAEGTTDGAYEAKITDLVFNFADETVIAMDNAIVPIKVDHTYTSPTGNGNVAVDELQIYPNPTSDVVYIKNANGAEVKVYNLNGRLLHHTRESRVDLSGAPAGIYLLQVGTQTVKVIKK